MKQSEIDLSLQAYTASFIAFIASNPLPKNWFNAPDHFAIKCTSKDSYDKTCNDVEKSTYEGIWQIELNNRYLASAKLSQKIELDNIGSVDWIEIMQPRPGMEPAEVFVEHVEFYFSNFDEITEILAKNDIVFELQNNSSHAWVNVVIDKTGREIKFSNKTLADMVEEERSDGKLKRRSTS